jgi:hypothetical protein
MALGALLALQATGCALLFEPGSSAKLDGSVDAPVAPPLFDAASADIRGVDAGCSIAFQEDFEASFNAAAWDVFNAVEFSVAGGRATLNALGDSDDYNAIRPKDESAKIAVSGDRVLATVDFHSAASGTITDYGKVMVRFETTGGNPQFALALTAAGDVSVISEGSDVCGPDFAEECVTSWINEKEPFSVQLSLSESEFAVAIRNASGTTLPIATTSVSPPQSLSLKISAYADQMTTAHAEIEGVRVARCPF